MSEMDKIGEAAQQISLRVKDEKRTLQKELLQIEVRALAIKRELETANLAHDRFLGFKPSIGGQFQCPRCWINHEIRAPLTAAPGNKGASVLKCGECHLNIALPVRP